MAKYKIGDEVTILDGSRIDRYTSGWGSGMPKFIGKHFRITQVCDAYDENRIGYRVDGDGADYTWDERGLALYNDRSLIINGIDFGTLIKRVVDDQVEVTVSVDPDHMEISIQPWKPFEYTCPNNK